MSRIPADLKKMMWDIADRGDVQAAAQFSEKFPGLAGDMQTRMDLVSGTKGMRKAIAPGFVPLFRPQYIPQRGQKLRRLAPAALALFALAGASYYVTQNILTPLPEPSQFGNIQPYKEPKTHEVNLPRAQPPAIHQDFESDSPKPFGRNDDQRLPPNPAPIESRPVRIQLSQVHLQNALIGIGQRYDYEVRIPANFPNPIIDADLTGTSAMNFINQLSNKYGFTAFDEGAGVIYLLSPQDPSLPTVLEPPPG